MNRIAYSIVDVGIVLTKTLLLRTVVALGVCNQIKLKPLELKVTCEHLAIDVL